MNFELTCFVEAPRDRVFAFLERAESLPRERWSIVPESETPRPRQLWIPVPGPTEVRLLVREHPTRLAYLWSLGSGLRGEVDYRLEPADEGTHLLQRVSLRVDGPLRALGRVVRSVLHGAAERRLDRIRERLEGEAHRSKPLSWPPDPIVVHGVSDEPA